MTPEEKAKELFETFKCYTSEPDKYVPKLCAVTCVDEIIKATDELDWIYYSDRHNTDWQEVKQEINKL